MDNKFTELTEAFLPFCLEAVMTLISLAFTNDLQVVEINYFTFPLQNIRALLTFPADYNFYL